MSNTTVKLGGKEWPLVWNKTVTIFRLQSLPKGQPPFDDFRNAGKALYATASYVWAMLPREAREKYADPEEVAGALDADTITGAASAVFEAINQSTKEVAELRDPKARSAKKSTPGSGRSSR